MSLRILGPDRDKDDDALDLLLACHQRIRYFIGLAQHLSEPEVPLPERAEAAARVQRYFVEALPRHVADEEQSLLPRLRGLGLDEVLAQMQQQHKDHVPDLTALILLCGLLAGAPTVEPARALLHTLSLRLGQAFEEHLALEERHLFFGLRERLGPQGMQELLHEMRARRQA